MPEAEMPPIVWPELEANCSRCTGLCCVAYPFVDGEKFGYEKPADKACKHLGPDCRCSIHENREEMGFKGCILFDCHGAGQRVVNEVFHYVNWQTEGVESGEILQAFRSLTRVHAALAQLKLLEDLPLTTDQQKSFRALFEELEPAQGWTAQSLAELSPSKAEQAVQNYAKSLMGSPAGTRLSERLAGGRT